MAGAPAVKNRVIIVSMEREDRGREKARETLESCRQNLANLQAIAERMRSELAQLISTIDRVLVARVAPGIVFPWCDKVDKLYEEFCDTADSVEDVLEETR